MAIALSAANSALFSDIITEFGQAAQNEVTADQGEKLAVLAVASEAYTSVPEFIAAFGDSPKATLLEWGNRGYYADVVFSAADKQTMDTIVALMRTAPDYPLDSTIIEKLLPLFETAGFLSATSLSQDTIKVYPFAALMAFAWWMNVLDAVWPWGWLVERPPGPA